VLASTKTGGTDPRERLAVRADASQGDVHHRRCHRTSSVGAAAGVERPAWHRLRHGVALHDEDIADELDALLDDRL
jgi:hypothetical protein